MNTLRCALIQTRTPAHQGAALAHIEPLIEQAAGQGAAFIATPEGSNLLQKDRDLFIRTAVAPQDDVFIEGVRGLAQRHGLPILIGSALVKREDGLFANRAMLIDAAGEIVETYDKIHMFDVDLPTGERYRESSLYTPGDRAVVAQTPWGGLGLTICYDVRFPGLFQALAQAGVRMITVPAAFTRPTGQAHWQVLLRARAIETGAFILAPAQGGFHEDGRGTHGHSLVVSPWGEVIAALDHDEPGVLMADLDLTLVETTRSAIPNLKNQRAWAAPLSF
jgi:predicted amidohydrolase